MHSTCPHPPTTRSAKLTSTAMRRWHDCMRKARMETDRVLGNAGGLGAVEACPREVGAAQGCLRQARWLGVRAVAAGKHCVGSCLQVGATQRWQDCLPQKAHLPV